MIMIGRGRTIRGVSSSRACGSMRWRMRRGRGSYRRLSEKMFEGVGVKSIGKGL